MSHLLAQETIYFANGNRSVGRLAGAEGEKIKLTVVRNGKISNYNLRRENVLLTFTDDGRYLIINSLDTDPAKAQEEIDAFNNAPGPRLPHDLLLKVSPPSVIPGTISYESDEVINYKTTAGASASINKRELAAVFYRNGRHQLLVPPATAVTVLNSTKAEMIRLSTPPPAPAPVATAQVATQKSTKTPAVVKSGPKTAKTGVKLTSNRNDGPPKPPTPEPKPAAPADRNDGPPKPVVTPEAPVVAEAVPAATPPVRNDGPPKPTLSDAQYQQYRTKALQQVEEFVGYLNIITDKELDDEKKDKAIEQVLKLFMADATIDVSSAKRPGVKKYKISDYLSRLKMLPYSSVSIEWNEIQYVSELTQAADGAYYGTITGQQTFTGYAENGQDVLYSDVTQKSIKVKLEAYRKSADAGAVLKWAVLLGNIGIVNKEQ